MSKELIAPATAADTQAGITVLGENIPCTFIASGLAGAETINIQIETTPGNYINMFSEGSQLELTATNNVLTVFGPGEYQLVKGITAGAAGAFMTSNQHK